MLQGRQRVEQSAIGHEEVGHVVGLGEGGVVRVDGGGAEVVEAAKDTGGHVLQPAAGDSICWEQGSSTQHSTHPGSEES